MITKDVITIKILKVNQTITETQPITLLRRLQHSFKEMTILNVSVNFFITSMLQNVRLYLWIAFGDNPAIMKWPNEALLKRRDASPV